MCHPFLRVGPRIEQHDVSNTAAVVRVYHTASSMPPLVRVFAVCMRVDHVLLLALGVVLGWLARTWMA